MVVVTFTLCILGFLYKKEYMFNDNRDVRNYSKRNYLPNARNTPNLSILKSIAESNKDE